MELLEKSFISLIILEGNAILKYGDEALNIKKTDSVFIPAGLKCKLTGKVQILVSKV